MTRALSQSEAGRPGRRGARQPVNGGRAGLAGPCGLQLHVGRGRDRAVTRCRDKGAARAFPRRRLKEPGPGAAARARPRPSPLPPPPPQRERRARPRGPGRGARVRCAGHGQELQSWGEGREFCVGCPSPHPRRLQRFPRGFAKPAYASPARR